MLLPWHIRWHTISVPEIIRCAKNKIIPRGFVTLGTGGTAFPPLPGQEALDKRAVYDRCKEKKVVGYIYNQITKIVISYYFNYSQLSLCAKASELTKKIGSAYGGVEHIILLLFTVAGLYFPANGIIAKFTVMKFLNIGIKIKDYKIIISSISSILPITSVINHLSIDHQTSYNAQFQTPIAYRVRIAVPPVPKRTKWSEDNFISGTLKMFCSEPGVTRTETNWVLAQRLS